MRYFGALEAGGTKMVCAIGDENGKLIEKLRIPTRTPEETMPPMIEFFRAHGVVSLGIGCFGPLDLDPASPGFGSITTTPKLAWQNYPIVREFSQALGVPVALDTDVNAAALGEATFGCTREVQNSLYITVGTGVGVGVIAGGKPYHGMIHPEGGHILLARHPDDPMGASCCPWHENCLEGLASGPALEKRWGEKGEALSARAEVWELESWYIGQAVANYIMMFSPQKIILGGGVMHQPGLLAQVRSQAMAHLGGYIRGKALDDPDSYITAPSLGDDQGVLGAWKLAFDADKEKENG